MAIVKSCPLGRIIRILPILAKQDRRSHIILKSFLLFIDNFCKLYTLFLYILILYINHFIFYIKILCLLLLSKIDRLYHVFFLSKPLMRLLLSYY